MSTRASAPTTLERPADPDRRRSPRRPHVVEAWICSPTATHPDERVEVTSVNLSRHGVAFDHAVALPVGAFYVLELGHGDQRFKCEVRTNRCAPLDDGRFEVAAEFC